MLSDYQNPVTATMTNTLFSFLFIHVIIFVTFISFCAKKKDEESIRVADSGPPKRSLKPVCRDIRRESRELQEEETPLSRRELATRQKRQTTCTRRHIDDELPNEERDGPGCPERKLGGNETTHFTPPHISAAPGRSLLRQKQKACPVHCQFSDESDDDSKKTFVDSADTSDIEFDSTQSVSSSNCSLLKQRCTCFCAQKRVRFQCPTSTSTNTFGFI